MTVPPDDPRYDLAAQFLPERLRLGLALAACVITADRLIWSQTVVARREFLYDDFDVLGDTWADARPPSEPDAELDEALAWLVEGEALDATAVAEVWELRRHAVELAARLPAVMLDSGGVKTELIDTATQLLHRLGTFWGRINVETNPAFDGQDIPDEDIQSGTEILFEELSAAARTI